jgi:hypothetical protein
MEEQQENQFPQQLEQQPEQQENQYQPSEDFKEFISQDNQISKPIPVRKIIAKTNIKREIGYMYYVTWDANGNLLIGKVPLSRSGRRKIPKKAKPIIPDVLKEETKKDANP